MADTKIQTKMLDQSGATDGQTITWDNAAGEWLPATPTGGGGGSGKLLNQQTFLLSGSTQSSTSTTWIDVTGASVNYTPVSSTSFIETRLEILSYVLNTASNQANVQCNFRFTADGASFTDDTDILGPNHSALTANGSQTGGTVSVASFYTNTTGAARQFKAQFCAQGNGRASVRANVEEARFIIREYGV